MFGCIAFSKGDGPRAPVDKYTPRGQPLIHVGTPAGVKGYRLFDPVTGKYFVALDITFDESKMLVYADHSAYTSQIRDTPCSATPPRLSPGLNPIMAT